MTTITFKKNNKLDFVIKLIVVGLFGLFMFLLYLYNINVDLKHEIILENDNLRKATIENTDFKDSLYKVTDVGSLKDLVFSRNLVEDKNPYYFKEGTLLWVAVR